MKNEREAAEVVRSWMKEEARLDDSGLHRVLARLPDTPQRRHRWLWPFDWRPFGPGATRSARPREATPNWRFTGMFTPIRVAAVTAVLALTGTLALVSGPLTPSGPAVAPGAEVPAVSMDPAHFTGTVVVWQEGEGETETLADRTVERWLARWSSTMTDPRVSGLGEAMDYLESIVVPGGGVILAHTGVGRVINDDGAWAIECQGAASMDTDAQIFCWQMGEETYEGLTSYLILTGDGTGTWQAEGWIYPGERPPFLEYEP